MIVLSAMSEEKLAKAIEKARIAYYRGLPTLTDKEYDALEDELRAINPRHPILKHSGAPVATKMKVKLPYPLPSLTKRKYGSGDTDKWLEANPGPYCVSWKIDGISGLYRSALAKLFTRGRSSSAYGGDISHLVPMLGLPKAKADVRGELVMKNSVFTEKWAQDYKNARNMAAGLTNLKSVHKAVSDLSFLAYELLEPRMKPSAAFAKLKSLGFKVAPYKVFQTLTEEKLLALLKVARANPNWEVDGLVVAVDKKTPVSKTDPTHTIAFKSDTEDASAVTTVLDVQWNLGRTGFYFPKLVVKPVVLKGATISYASAKSAEFVKVNRLGPGAKIRLRRSGDVIPDVRAEDILAPGRLKWPKEYEWSGANIRPPRGSAPSTELQGLKLTHFFVTLGIERFRQATVDKYVEAGFDTPRKILRMTEAQFTQVEGVSRTSKLVYQQLDKLKKEGVELHMLMYASSIFGRAFGSRKLGAIVQAHPNILSLSNWNTTKLTQLVDDIPGFDVKQAQAFARALPRFTKFYAALGLKTVKPRVVRAVGSKLHGLSVLFTGFRDRDLEKIIVQQGGTLATTVKSAKVLLAEDVNGSSSKLEAARELGIKIMTAPQFRKRYGV